MLIVCKHVPINLELCLPWGLRLKMKQAVALSLRSYVSDAWHGLTSPVEHSKPLQRRIPVAVCLQEWPFGCFCCCSMTALRYFKIIAAQA